MKKTLSILYIREVGMWGEVLCGRNKFKEGVYK